MALYCSAMTAHKHSLGSVSPTVSNEAQRHATHCTLYDFFPVIFAAPTDLSCDILLIYPDRKSIEFFILKQPLTAITVSP